MSLDLTALAMLVRPAQIVPLRFRWTPTRAPLLLYGEGADAVATFARGAGQAGWGTTVVLLGLDEAASGKADTTARAHSFQPWFAGCDVPGLPPDARTWVKQDPTETGYATHRPVLLEAVRRTTGPVLELGAGDTSTVALHEACAGRLLVSVESNAEWMETLRHMESPMHRFEHAPDPAETPRLDEEWAVILVDHAPGETRKRAVERARHHADLVVVHDTEELSYRVEDVLATFRYRRDFRRFRPWTTVVSERRPIWQDEE